MSADIIALPDPLNLREPRWRRRGAFVLFCDKFGDSPGLTMRAH